MAFTEIKMSLCCQNRLDKVKMCRESGLLLYEVRSSSYAVDSRRHLQFGFEDESSTCPQSQKFQTRKSIRGGSLFHQVA